PGEKPESRARLGRRGFLRRIQGFDRSANLPGYPRELVVRARSNDQRPAQVHGRLGADMLDAAAPVRAEIIVAEAVAVGIDDPLEPRTKGRPLGRIDLYLEYRELHALAEVRAGAGDAAQAADAAGARRRDVVAHEH